MPDLGSNFGPAIFYMTLGEKLKTPHPRFLRLEKGNMVKTRALDCSEVHCDSARKVPNITPSTWQALHGQIICVPLLMTRN